MRENLNAIPEFQLSADPLGGLPFKLEKLAAHTGYNPAAPHRHGYYELFLFLTGSGLHMIDFQEWDIVPGHLHFLNPGQIHYIRRAPETTGWVLKFTPDFLQNEEGGGALFQKIPFLQTGREPLIKTNSSDFDELMQLVEQIREEMDRKGVGYNLMIHHYLRILLLKCHRLYDYTSTQKVSSVSRSFQVLLEKHYLTRKPVSYYCEQLHVSDDKLNQEIKRDFGQTPVTLIAKRLLLEAKRLLLHSDRSVKEIAYGLQFKDNAYFTRWFKKWASCSPGEFRLSNRKKYHTQRE